MATNYNVISNQNWADFYEKIKTVGEYKINHKFYIKFLKDAYLEGVLLGNLTPQTPKYEVTKYVHLEFWKYIDWNASKHNKFKNKNLGLAIRKIYVDSLNKILD